MPFLPNHKYDVFVSYAHANNEPLPGADQGWVTTLAGLLERVLRDKVGDAAVFRDHRLTGNEPLTPAILENLEGSAILVIVLSNRYLDSEWCEREREAFLGFIGSRPRSSSRIFVVEYEDLEDRQRPAELEELIRYRFWVKDEGSRHARTLGLPRPDPNDARGKLYYDVAMDLGADVAKELRLLSAGADTAAKPSEPERVAVTPPPEPAGEPVRAPVSPPSQPDPPTESATGATARDNGGGADLPPERTVLLADVTDDLDAQRNDLRRTLEQAGLRCLPETNFYPNQPEMFQRAFDEDLRRASRFVQLLSDLPGKKPPGLPHSIPAFQAVRAREHGLPILQWRHPNAEIAKVEDEGHRALLDGETVLSMPFEDFKREVKEYRPPRATEPIDAFVFVDCTEADKGLAGKVVEWLQTHGAAHALPLALSTNGETPNDAELAEDTRTNLELCDAVIILYGSAPVSWVRRQLLLCNKALASRSERPRGVVVLRASSDQATRQDLGMSFPTLPIITIGSTEGPDAEALEKLLMQSSDEEGS